MPNLTYLPLFIVASISLLLIPGPAVLYILTRSVDQGRTAGLISVLGLQTGTLVHVAGAALGLSAILLSSALAFTVVKFMGAAYLIYLGVRTLITPARVATEEHVEPTRLRRIYSQGVVVNTFNPKLALFFFAFFPQFVDPDRGTVGFQMLILGCVFVVLALCTDSTYAMIAGTLGQWLKRSQRFWKGQRYFAGTIYIGLGLTTALTGRHKG